MLKKTIIAGLTAAALGTGLAPALAADAAPAPTPEHTLTGNMGIFSQYIFRGLTQTDRDPALQGGFDYSHSSGFYAGTWASNISWLRDFGAYSSGGSLEWDFYGGYKWAFAEDWVLDLGVLTYYYPGSYPPGATKADTTEVYAGLGWKFLSVKYSYVVSNKTFGFPDSEGSDYIEGNISYDIVDKVNDYLGKVTLIGHVGHQGFKHYGDYNYTDWKGGIAADLSGFTIGFYVTGTDADGNLYTNRFGKDTSETQYVGYIQKTF